MFLIFCQENVLIPFDPCVCVIEVKISQSIKGCQTGKYVDQTSSCLVIAVNKFVLLN